MGYLYNYIIPKELTVVHPLRKNGEVTKSQNHTISLLSLQGCAQFGFKLKRSTLGNFQKCCTFLSANTVPRLLIHDTIVTLRHVC